MIKELTPQEVARKLADEGCFEGFVSDNKTCIQVRKAKIIGVNLNKSGMPFVARISDTILPFFYCAIEVPDPEPKYIPYPDNECPPLKCGDVLISKDDKTENIIVSIDKRKDEKGHVFIQSSWTDNKELFENFTYLDGSPIGKKEE